MLRSGLSKAVSRTAAASVNKTNNVGALRFMSAKEIKFGVDGRTAMLRGVDVLADAVQVSAMFVALVVVVVVVVLWFDNNAPLLGHCCYCRRLLLLLLLLLRESPSSARYRTLLEGILDHKKIFRRNSFRRRSSVVVLV
jgi:hypothetical protein